MAFIQNGLDEDKVLTEVYRYFYDDGFIIVPLDKDELDEDDPCDFVVEDDEEGRIGVVTVGYVAEAPFHLQVYRAAKQCHENCYIACVRYNRHGKAHVEVAMSDDILDDSGSGSGERGDAPSPAPALTEDPIAFARAYIAAQAEHILCINHFDSVKPCLEDDFDFIAKRKGSDRPTYVRMVVCDGPDNDDAIYAITDALPRSGDALIFEYLMYPDASTSWNLKPLSAYPTAEERMSVAADGKRP